MFCMHSHNIQGLGCAFLIPGWDLCEDVLDELHVPKPAKARVGYHFLHDLQHWLKHHFQHDSGPSDLS